MTALLGDATGNDALMPMRGDGITAAHEVCYSKHKITKLCTKHKFNNTTERTGQFDRQHTCTHTQTYRFNAQFPDKPAFAGQHRFSLLTCSRQKLLLPVMGGSVA